MRPLNLGDVPFVDMAAVHDGVRDDLRAAFERVLGNGCFNGGHEVERFEDALAARLGVDHVVGVGSGTAALHLALVAAGIGPGDDVVLPPNSFFATAEAVLAAGATPVFADVEIGTALLDPAAVEDAITPRTTAVIAVHLYGQAVDADRFRAIAARRGLLLLEDAAQAIGGAWNVTPVGAIGAAAAFSFYATKNLGALGEAGAVSTGDAHVASRVRMLRTHGEAGKHVHALWGWNERLDTLQAAFLSAKLPHLDDAQHRRDRVAERYQELLSGVEEVELLERAPQARHVHHLMVVRVPRRDAVLEALRHSGIGAAVHYPTPIHLQPACEGLGGRRGQMPNAEALADSVLSLPLFPGLSDEQVDRVVHALSTALKETR